MNNELNYSPIDRLEALREMTKLSPIDTIRLAIMKKQTEKSGEFDYSAIDGFEYSLRMKKLIMKVENAWRTFNYIEHHDSSIYDFADNVIDSHIKQKIKTKKK